jgi:hypothetical protein
MRLRSSYVREAVVSLRAVVAASDEIDVDVLDDGDVNLSGNGVVVEVARKASGMWEFWAVRIGEHRYRFGQASRQVAGPLAKELEREYQEQMAARRA